MTKKKSTTDTLPPTSAQDAEWMRAPLTAAERQAVSDADVETHQPSPAENHQALVDAAGVVHAPLSEPCDLLSRALESCNELQHSDFSATRHRAMTLIAEARALL